MDSGVLNMAIEHAKALIHPQQIISKHYGKLTNKNWEFPLRFYTSPCCEISPTFGGLFFILKAPPSRLIHI